MKITKVKRQSFVSLDKGDSTLSEALEALDVSLETFEMSVNDFNSSISGMVDGPKSASNKSVSSAWYPATKQEVDAFYQHIIGAAEASSSAQELIIRVCRQVRTQITVSTMSLNADESIPSYRMHCALVSERVQTASNRYKKLAGSIKVRPVSNLHLRCARAVEKGNITQHYLSTYQSRLDSIYDRVFGDAQIDSIWNKVRDALIAASDFHKKHCRGY